jgi:hypothetical protein
MDGWMEAKIEIIRFVQTMRWIVVKRKAQRKKSAST